MRLIYFMTAQLFSKLNTKMFYDLDSKQLTLL